MFSFVFKSKLRRLNPDLYVREEHTARVDEEWRIASLYVRRNRLSAVKSNYNYLNSDAAQFLRDAESGALDEHVCGVPANWVPEHDIYNEEGRLLAAGWRTIIAKLLKRKLTSPDRAKAVFGYVPCDYDRLSIEQRIKKAKNA